MCFLRSSDKVIEMAHHEELNKRTSQSTRPVVRSSNVTDSSASKATVLVEATESRKIGLGDGASGIVASEGWQVKH
jgi:hypothetical protein